MVGGVDSTRKDELIKPAPSAFEPYLNATAAGFKEFELNRPAGLLLDDDSA